MNNTASALRTGVRAGLTMAIVALFILLTGMVEGFTKRELVVELFDTELLSGPTLGVVIMLLLGLAPGLMAARRVRKEQQVRAAKPSAASLLIAGLVAGLVVGATIAVLVLLLERANLRTVFVNATDGLLEILSLGREGVPAMGLVLVAGGLLGLLGAAFQLLPRRVGQILLLLVGAWLLLALLEFKFLVFMAALIALGWLTQRFGGRLQQSGIRTKAAGGPNWPQIAFLALLALGWIAVLLVGPALLGDYWARVLGFVGLFSMLGLGLNIVVGFAGLLDLGYVAFYAIGAYTMALFTSPASSLGTAFSFWMILPLALVTAGIAGVLLGFPVLRMRGDYLAIVTLGFGEIIRILALSDLLKPVIGGPQGILETPSPQILGLQFVKPLHFYYLVILGCLLVAFVSLRLSHSRIGRAWIAMREDEDVAQAMGINLVKTKLLAFATGAAFAGISGAIFASWQHAIFPADFTLFISINVLVLIIIGGIGSIPGVILGAAVLVGLPEVLREVQDYRILAYGALLVIMMIARPEGLWPSQRRRLEMHEADTG